jgi:hypothetical protein
MPHDFFPSLLEGNSSFSPLMRVVRKNQSSSSAMNGAALPCNTVAPTPLRGVPSQPASSPWSVGLSHSGAAAPSPSSVSFTSPNSHGIGGGLGRPDHLVGPSGSNVNQASLLATPAAPLELPIGAMDVEVFERFIMRVLTSLHRLVAKMHSEIAEGHALHNAGGGSSGGSTTMHSPGGLETTSAAYAWTLVRRVTKRIEKLSIMEPVLEQKRAFLLARTAELESRAAASADAVVSQSGGKEAGGRNMSAAAAAAQILHFGGQDATHYQRVQSELLLVEALITKVHGSVETFQEVETKMMAQLFRN